MKKLITIVSLCLAVMMVLPIAAYSASVDEDPSTGIQYQNYAGGVRTIGYSGPGGDVIIPLKVENQFVIGVAAGSFTSCATITGVTIPREATWVGDNAFACCESLESVTFNTKLDSIGNDAFFSCTSLKNVTLPYVYSVCERAFSHCTSLCRVTIQHTTTTINKWAFEDCCSLESITIPETLETVHYGAFSGCSSLKKVYYMGSEEDWKNINIGDDNEELLSAQIVYNYKPPRFSDVKDSSYFSDPVLWAVENGITKGTSKTKFSPSDPCTRGQIVTFLWRAAGSPVPKDATCPFRDVTRDKFYYNAVLWAVENGITQGTSAKTFSPSDPCTRGQIVTFLWRTAESPAPRDASCPFSDVSRDKFYYNAVLWAVGNGVTEGTSETTFSPASPCTRAQVVTFIYRDHFSGDAEIPDEDPTGDDGVLDVAFFGDSFTQNPRTKDHLEAIAEGKHSVISHDYAKGETTLSYHYNLWKKMVQNNNRKKDLNKWDVVVLNESGTSPALMIKEELPPMSDEEYNEYVKHTIATGNYLKLLTELFGKDKIYYNLCQSTIVKTEEGTELSEDGLQRHVGQSWVPSNMQCFAGRDWLKENCNVNRIMVNLTDGFDPEVILNPRDFDNLPEDFHPNLMYGYCHALALYCTIFDEPCAEQNNGILTDDDIPGDTPEEKEAYMVMIKNLVQEELDFQNSH